MEIIPITTCGVPIIKQLLPMTILLTRLFTIRVPLVLNFLPVTLSQDLPQQEKVYHLPLKLTVPGVVRKKVVFLYKFRKNTEIFFPALGYRSYSTMRPGSIGTQGCFWSAHPVAKGNNYYLRTSSVDVQPHIWSIGDSGMRSVLAKTKGLQ